ncbi:MAG: FAD-binding protein [Endomicrobia bacterium]|nr:FAD-binding protein [Endomicrobiia bacterium]MCL2799294.1 FAD-binding protein [Endomicrobiia bacterium]
MKYDAVVIGSGISGLTSALLIAQKGKKVAIAEQAPHIAPLIAGFDRNIRIFEKMHKVHFESGFHYGAGLGENEICGFLFKKLGISVPAVPCDKDNCDEIHLLKSGKVFKTPVGKQSFQKRLEETFPAEKSGIAAFLDDVQKTIDEMPFLNLHKRDYSYKELLIWPDDDRTLQGVLDKHFKTSEIKVLLSFPTILYGTPPSKTPFSLYCSCSGLMFESIWKIKGGAGDLVTIYRKALKENNIEIFTNKKAVKIEFDEKTSDKKIIFADNSEIICETCVSSVHPKEFVKIAPEGTYRKNHIERINSLEETPGFFILYGVLENGKRYANTNTSFLASDNFKNVYPEGKEKMMYVNFSDTDPQCVCAVVFENGDEKEWEIPEKDYIEKKNKTVAEIKKRLKELYPEVADNVNFCDAATPKTFKKYVNYYSGYGIMHKANSVAVLPATKIPGLFLTGQAVVAPGLMGALLSSFLTDKIMSSANSKNI